MVERELEPARADGQPGLLHRLRRYLNTPSSDPFFWGVVGVVAVGFLFLMVIPRNDWLLNTEDLQRGLDLYQGTPYVYPPWALVLMWPYRLMGPRLSRAFAVLTVGWLAHVKGWRLKEFLLTIANPYFIFTALLSNVDVLVFVLPLVLWEASAERGWQVAGRGLALALLALKPHVGAPVALDLLWRERHTGRALIGPVALALALIGPVSLLGSPPLIVQWANQLAGQRGDQVRALDNNVSLTDTVGPLLALVIVMAALGGLYLLMRHMRRAGRRWTESHTLSALYLAAVMISPYASNQSVIAAFALLPSAAGLLSLYVLSFGVSLLGLYRPVWDAVWTLLFGLIALWLFQPPAVPAEKAV